MNLCRGGAENGTCLWRLVLLLSGVKQRHIKEFYAQFRACSLQGALEAAYPLGLTALIQKHQGNLLAQLLQPGLLPTCEEERETREQLQQAVLREQDENNLQLQEAEEQQRYGNKRLGMEGKEGTTKWSPQEVLREPGSSCLRAEEIAKLLETENEDKDASRRAGQNEGQNRRRSQGLESDKERETERRHSGVEQGATSLPGGSSRESMDREGGGRCKARDPLSLFERGGELSGYCSPPPPPASTFTHEVRRPSGIQSDSNILETDRFQGPRGLSSSSCSVSSAGGPGGGGSTVFERRVDRAVVCVYGQVRANDATPHIWR